jgi:hypothetical protein
LKWGGELKVFIMLCVVCAEPSWAADPLAGLLSCRDLTDAAARLACFDRETAALARAPAAPPLAAAPVTTPASPSPATLSPATPTAPSLTPEQKFGLSSSSIVANEEAAGAQAPKEAKLLQARITALALAGDGRALFTLDNSQVWRQMEADGTDVMARLGDPVTISRGLLGSYWLQLKTGRGCKVTRLR